MDSISTRAHPFNPEDFGFVSSAEEDCHDQDLLDWLSSQGVRAPDWSIDPCVFDRAERLRTKSKSPAQHLGQSKVAGVYFFYSRSKGQIAPLYVGKAANLWSRMQTHWRHPDERGWMNSYLEDIEAESLDDVVMACAWREEERAGVEARLIKLLKPRYCRRTE